MIHFVEFKIENECGEKKKYFHVSTSCPNVRGHTYAKDN